MNSLFSLLVEKNLIILPLIYDIGFLIMVALILMRIVCICERWESLWPAQWLH